MRIISFDIGIKNLAYCILDFNNHNQQLEIKEWNVINLCEDQYFCKIKDIKSDNCCNKEAKYFKNDIYYCKKHTKGLDYQVIPKSFNDKTIKKMKLDELIEFCKNNSIELEKPYTKLSIINKINDYKKQHFLENITSMNADQYNLIYLGIKLKEKLNKVLNFKELNIDIAIIENQISPIANRMKTIQGMLSQYLIMNDLHNIIFYSASNKLKTFTNSNSKTDYKERKKLSVTYTNQLLSEYIFISSWLNYFNTHKKKDDLADCFLQGLSYLIQKHNCNIIQVQ
jgi:hypothetical protein